MKVKEITSAYKHINAAKLAKMDDNDKFTVIKACRMLKKIATDYDEFVSDAQEKLKDTDFESWQEKAQKWQGKTAQTQEEREELTAINAYFNTYMGKVNKCVLEEAEKDVELSVEKLSDDAFKKMLASNDDWNVETIMAVSSVLCE